MDDRISISIGVISRRHYNQTGSVKSQVFYQMGTAGALQMGKEADA
jgi:hypothetical protein